MHASLVELLENLKPGLLWVAQDGLVRYANADATGRTGLATGRRLFDPDLTRAVAAAIAGRVPRAVNSIGTAAAELKCRVIPGLANDDAFVLVAPESGKDGGAGFDNLMQAIRTEVRDPLRKAKLALVDEQQRGRPHTELDAMQASLSELFSVVDRLVELASLWDSGALLANDRIELWPMLQKCWLAVEPLALQRGISVRFRAQQEAANLAALYGSERWLARVFQECLEAAVRGSRSNGVIDIEHRQMGPRAIVVFRDTSVFAAKDVQQGAVEMPRNTSAKPGTRAAPAAAREQIGLRLCQHIVSLHGGQLREEEEDGLRNFLIELPTGAPHQSDQSQLDIAQAQVYARDLAALMTRSRKKAPPAVPADTAGTAG